MRLPDEGDEAHAGDRRPDRGRAGVLRPVLPRSHPRAEPARQGASQRVRQVITCAGVFFRANSVKSWRITSSLLLILTLSVISFQFV